MSIPHAPMRAGLAAATLVTFCTGMVLADPPVVRVKTPAGEAYADANHMTLYTFDRDTPGVSNCNGACAANWPPLLAPANAVPAGDFTAIRRKDGTYQWALNGKPLYTWVKDRNPGDMTGDGVGGVWHVAR